MPQGNGNVPSTSKFFSGKRFPLATLSNREDQMFFLEPSLLVGRLFVPAAFDPCGLEDIVWSRPTMPQRAFTQVSVYVEAQGYMRVEMLSRGGGAR